MTTADGAHGELPDQAHGQPAGHAEDQAAGHAGGGPARGDADGQAAGHAEGQAGGPVRGDADGQAGSSEPGKAPEEVPDDGHGHGHRDVSGGWLRPAVFGAMDGLVTNASLIAGVSGGGGSTHTLILTGLAGLGAGAFSMATGEYVSVSSQNELVGAEVSKERLELQNHPDAERRELAAVFRQRGVDADLADQVARQVSAHPEQALLVHVREELGVDHQDLPSPITAAAASLVTFAVGALIPLLPYLAGFDSLATALILAAIAAFVGGGVVSRITDRPFLRGAVRQLALATVAAGLTFAIGMLVHSVAP
jgi:vacuolar iron transporter family protein